MVDGARGRTALTRIEVYPGAAHDFDRANLPLHAVGGNADAAVPEHGHIGTDAEARADSQKRVAEWLARWGWRNRSCCPGTAVRRTAALPLAYARASRKEDLRGPVNT